MCEFVNGAEFENLRDGLFACEAIHNEFAVGNSTFERIFAIKALQKDVLPTGMPTTQRPSMTSFALKDPSGSCSREND